MVDRSPPFVPLHQRLHCGWVLARFAWQTLIAPWPPFAFFFLIIAVSGAIAPLIQIRSMASLINMLAAHLAAPPSPPAGGLADLLAPFLPSLLPLVLVMLLNRVIYFDPFQEYLAAQLNERVKERFDRLFFGKALAMRLERFDRPEYYD